MIISLITSIIFGALAGWLAGIIFKGKGFGILGNIVIGILGSAIGSFIFSILGFESYGGIASFIVSVIGAIILLAIINFFKK